MRVLIVGQSWLAEELLFLCRRRGDDIAAVVAPKRGDRLATTAEGFGIPVLEEATLLGADLVPDGVDVILCAHAHLYVSIQAREKARLGALGYHPSLLPRHRGRDAVRWTIHMRDVITGGTVYWMDDRADTGPIAAQDWCWVRPDDGPVSLWQRELGPMGLRLFGRVLEELDAGIVTAVPQDGAMATWEPSWSAEPLAGVKGAR